jgi:alkyl sulfatase BDS1-like metallo-beta-lactamase superfamily hydrolase
LKVDWVLEDEAGGETRRIELSNGALNHRPGSHGPNADLTVRTTRAELVRFSAGRTALAAALAQNALRMQGRVDLMHAFVDGLDEFDPLFKVIEP